MKKLTCLLFASLGMLALPACGQSRQPAQITFKVIDETGAPVAGGTVRASTFSHWVPGEGFGRDVNDTYTAEIDKTGIAVLNAESVRGSFAYGVYPQGKYYPGRGGEYRFKEVISGRWEPWNPNVTVAVPRIINPIPLYARKVRATELPTMGPVGFDLMVSDWVAPHGKGKTSDFMCEVATVIPMTDPAKPFESVLTITFPNIGDGFHPLLAQPKQRLLELPRQAPENGYEPRLTKRIARAAEGAALETSTREDQNFFFRVRTVLDPNGKVVRALYGKIHGDITWDTLNSSRGHLQFTYYLNPTLLDRNLEFDPTRNLFPHRLDGTLGLEP